MAEEEIEGGEASGGLGNFSDPEKDVGDLEVPVALVLRDHPSQHLLQSLIKAGHKGGTLTSQDLRWDADSAGEQDEFLCNGFGFSEGNCLWISGGIVDNHQDVFMSPGRLR